MTDRHLRATRADQETELSDAWRTAAPTTDRVTTAADEASRVENALLDSLDPFLTTGLCEAYAADTGLPHEPLAVALSALRAR